jgi:transcriptional regulator GlxA family with amidase domain
MPPKRYYDLIRLKRAQKLMTETEMPITEVAIRCGYQSSTQFSAQFKKAFGTSPSAQRQEARR